MKTDKKRFILGYAVMIVFMIVLTVINNILSIDKTDLSGKLNIVYENEKIRTYSLVIDEKTSGSYLNFKTHGCIVEVYTVDEILYHYGHEYAMKKQMIGRIYSRVSIPQEAYGQKIYIKLKKSDSNASLDLNVLELCSSEDEFFYYVTNESLGSVTAPFFISAGLIAIISSLFLGYRDQRTLRLVVLGFISIGFSVELMDTGGHFLIALSNQHLWNILFHLISYCLPGLCLYYFYLVETHVKVKKVILTGVIFNLTVFIAAVLFCFFGPYRLCDFRRFLAVEIVLDLSIAVYGLYRMFADRKYSERNAIILVILVAWLIPTFFSLLRFSEQFITYHPRLFIDIETVESILILFIMIYMFVSFIREEQAKRREEEIKKERLENELNVIRYKNFASQMQPHFLYNALSSIQEMVFDDPEYASQIIGDFTVHLRSTIKAMRGDSEITFAEEMKNIRAYVNIEKMRFNGRLEVDYDIEVDDFMVIPLSIQPLVENAIKHGVYERGKQGGRVFVHSYETEDAYIIEVRDNGIGFNVEKTFTDIREGRRDSTGLFNLVYRLENVMKARVKIDSKIGEGTTVIVTFPKNEISQVLYK